MLGHVSVVPTAVVTPLLWFQPSSSAVPAGVVIRYTFIDLKPLLQFGPQVRIELGLHVGCDIPDHLLRHDRLESVIQFVVRRPDSLSGEFPQLLVPFCAEGQPRVVRGLPHRCPFLPQLLACQETLLLQLDEHTLE